MEQEGFEWHKWRMGGIGSSDASVVMGVSPYKTIDQLYLEKIGQGEEQESNFAMLRGKELEPIARANVELSEDIDFEPVTKEMGEYKFMRASLDGWNEERKIVLEIKCLGKDKHAMALAGEIPIEYVYQLAHQILVSDAKEVWYYSFTGTEGHLIKMPSTRFKRECESLLKECISFWDKVKKKTPPKIIKACEKNPLKDIWNENCGKLPKVRALRGRRATMAKARWDSNKDNEYWIEVVKKMSESPFLNGENDRGWKADFDFFVRPDTQDKVLEGKYNRETSKLDAQRIINLVKKYSPREPIPEELSDLERDFFSRHSRLDLVNLEPDKIKRIVLDFKE